MDTINLTETLIGREVERLFSKNPARSNGLCTNPVTGGDYVRGVDPIATQKKAAYRALLAREWFAFTGPRDATPLPINERDREYWKRTGRPLDYIIALYARSLSGRYDVKKHPAFADYVSGVLWEHENVEGGGQLPHSPEQLAEMKSRFPPRELEGMESGFCWYSPKRKKQAKKSGRLNQARYDAIKGKQLEHAQSTNTQPTRYVPIDEVVKIPEAVLSAAARANSFYQASKAQTPPEN
jgi:hypothetical protein